MSNDGLLELSLSRGDKSWPSPWHQLAQYKSNHCSGSCGRIQDSGGFRGAVMRDL